MFIHPQYHLKFKTWPKRLKKMDGKGQIVEIVDECYVKVIVLQLPEFYVKEFENKPTSNYGIKLFVRYLHRFGRDAVNVTKVSTCEFIDVDGEEVEVNEGEDIEDIEDEDEDEAEDQLRRAVNDDLGIDL